MYNFYNDSCLEPESSKHAFTKALNGHVVLFGTHQLDASTTNSESWTWIYLLLQCRCSGGVINSGLKWEFTEFKFQSNLVYSQSRLGTSLNTYIYIYPCQSIYYASNERLTDFIMIPTVVGLDWWLSCHIYFDRLIYILYDNTYLHHVIFYMIYIPSSDDVIHFTWYHTYIFVGWYHRFYMIHTSYTFSLCDMHFICLHCVIYIS